MKNTLRSPAARIFLLSLLLASLQAEAQNLSNPMNLQQPRGSSILDMMGATTNALQTLNAANAHLFNTQEGLDNRVDPRIVSQQQAALTIQSLQQVNLTHTNCLKKLIKEEEMEEETTSDIFDDLGDDEEEEEEEEEEEDSSKVGGCEVPEDYEPDYFEQFDNEKEDDITCNDSFDIQINYHKERKFSNCQKKEIVRLQAATECFRGLESSLLKAAQPIQNHISQQTGVIQEGVDLFEQGISGYSRSIQLIDEDMEGDNGYKAKLEELESIARTVDHSIDGSYTPSEAANLSGAPTGGTRALRERIEQFENEDRGNLATKWIRNIEDKTRSCFNNDPQVCSDKGIQKPQDCYRTLLCGTGSATSQKATCQYNTKILNNMFQNFQMSDAFGKKENYGNLNPANLGQLEGVADTEFKYFSDRFLNALQTQGRFRGNPRAVGQIRTLAQLHMSTCYDQQKKLFMDAISSNTNFKNNPYQKDINEYKQKKLALKDEINKINNLITDKLTNFQTKFTKTFNAELREFKEDCRAQDSARAGYDCLIRLRNHLNDHIDGTGNAPMAVMQVPSLANKESPYQQVRCIGYKDCINKLENTRKMYIEERESLEQKEITAINQHNEAIRSFVDTTGKAFAQAFSGPIIEGSRQFINAKLSAFNIGASITSEKRDAESLEMKSLGIKTGGEDGAELSIYKAPKDILAVMGTRSGLQEIGSIDRVQKAIAKRLEELSKNQAKNSKLKQEAGKRAEDCKIADEIQTVCNQIPLEGNKKKCSEVTGNVEDILKELQNKVLKKITNTKGDDFEKFDKGDCTNKEKKPWDCNKRFQEHIAGYLEEKKDDLSSIGEAAAKKDTLSSFINELGSNIAPCKEEEEKEEEEEEEEGASTPKNSSTSGADDSDKQSSDDDRHATQGGTKYQSGTEAHAGTTANDNPLDNEQKSSSPPLNDGEETMFNFNGMNAKCTEAQKAAEKKQDDLEGDINGAKENLKEVEEEDDDDDASGA